MEIRHPWMHRWLSRAIVYPKCCTENKASTVLQYFKQGVQEFGLPSRVRGDQGIEKVDVARYMIIYQESDRGGFIGLKGYWLKLMELVQPFTRNCMISLGTVEFWTLWMSYTCWLCNRRIFADVIVYIFAH